MRTPLPLFPALRSRRGITLIEVLIVITLVGILAAIAIPRVAGTSDPYDAVDQARRIHAAMANARARAVATQREHRFVLASGGVWKVEEDDAGTWKATGDSGTATGTVTIDGASSGTILFYTRGRVDAARTLLVTVDGHQQKIDLLASGMTRW